MSLETKRFSITLFIIILILLSCRPFSVPSTPEPDLSIVDVTDVPTESPILPSTELPPPASLNNSGPFVIFEGASGIWITNPDGSFPTQITNYQINGDLNRAISPDRDRIAFVVESVQGYVLVILKIPSGESEGTIRLIDLKPEERIVTDTTTSDSKAFAATAIQRYDNLAWQPGSGRLLAFVGAINGPTADLYLLDTQTWEITQLTDDLSQAIMPSWSPDGKYILHYGVSWVPPYGGAIVNADRLDGVWAIRVSDGEKITLPVPKGSSPNFVGWQDDLHYLTYDSDDECYSQNLQSVNITSGQAAQMMAASFYYQISQSPENGALLFSSKAGCESSLGEGVFILLPDQAFPQKLLEKKAFEINWLPESNVFLAYPEALLSPDGNIHYEPPVYESSFKPAISKYGYEAWEVIENQRGRVVVNLPGSDWRTIFEESVDQLIWSPTDGNVLLIVSQGGLLYAASYPDFSPRLMGNLEGKVYQAIWLP